MELWAYIKIGDWAQFTGIRQDVLLKIADIVEAAGTRFAAPTRLTYVTEAGRVDGSLRRTEEDVSTGGNSRLSSEARTGK
jgi:MscS family membrane protein